MQYCLDVKGLPSPEELIEIKHDLKRLSIEETCDKHNIQFKELVKQNFKKAPRASRRPNPHRYIYPRGDSYIIQKRVNNKFDYFGTYKSLEDACKVKEMLIEYEWNKSCLSKICKLLGVERIGNDK